MLDDVQGKGMLIHHWDADGITSAKLILEKLGKKITSNKTPILGNYFLTEKELEECKAFDFVIITDMNLPKENIIKLSENSKVLIFDHHLGAEIKEVFHHNPIIKGENPDDYPSASWIVNEYLKNEVNLFSILGIIGDHEQKIKNNPKFWRIITEFCEENNLTFEDLHKMVYLLDSNYKMGEKKAVEKAPHTLLNLKAPRDILENPEWNKNYTLIENELNKQLTNTNETTDNIILKKMNTTFNIISTVTRKIAWKTQKNTIVVNTGFFDDLDQIYVRTNNENMEPMIQRGKQLGFKCGGKKEVLGAIIPKEKTNSFVEEIIEFLS